MKSTSFFLLLAALAPVPALAQLRPLPAPTETRPVTLPSPSRSTTTDGDDQAAANARLHERLQPSSPRAAASKPVAAPKPAAPVYDHNGQRMNGMRQAGPNRVMDTRTGRYYDTEPSGDGQRIVDKNAGGH